MVFLPRATVGLVSRAAAKSVKARGTGLEAARPCLGSQNLSVCVCLKGALFGLVSREATGNHLGGSLLDKHRLSVKARLSRTFVRSIVPSLTDFQKMAVPELKKCFLFFMV